MGTLINCLAIITGALIGKRIGALIPQTVRDTVLRANGAAVIAIGINGIVSKSLVLTQNTVATRGTLNLILSICLGAVIGSWIDIEGKLERFGEYLKRHSGNTGDSGFTEAFMTASLTVCIGAMAIVGAIEEGITGDMSILLSKAILDFVIILVMASSLGNGVLFSFIPVGILQGSVTLLAGLLVNAFTPNVLDALSLTGSLIIALVGVNLLFGKTISTANLLPALLFTVLFTAVPWIGL